jgi:hypothetical protein
MRSRQVTGIKGTGGRDWINQRKEILCLIKQTVQPILNRGSQELGWRRADYEKGPARIPGLFKNEILTAMDLTDQSEKAAQIYPMNLSIKEYPALPLIK